MPGKKICFFFGPAPRGHLVRHVSQQGEHIDDVLTSVALERIIKRLKAFFRVTEATTFLECITAIGPSFFSRFRRKVSRQGPPLHIGSRKGRHPATQNLEPAHQFVEILLVEAFERFL